jgi:hypothetical protein
MDADTMNRGGATHWRLEMFVGHPVYHCLYGGLKRTDKVEVIFCADHKEELFAVADTNI